MEIYLLFLILNPMLLKLTRSINLISNGSFDLPAVPVGQYLLTATGWSGYHFDLMQLYRTLGHGQYIDLQRYIGENGYIQQNITLPKSANYNLTFLQQAFSTNYQSHIMQIYWNGQLQATQIPTTTNTTFQSLVLAGLNGTNLLTFKQIGTDSDYNGLFIDQISLTEIIVINNQTQVIVIDNQTEVINNSTQTIIDPIQVQIITKLVIPEKIKDLTSAIIPSPLNQVSGLRFAYLFAEDLWLYRYDKIQHGGTLVLVFNATSTIQSYKFRVLDTYLHWQRYSDFLPISDYTPYTQKQFQQIEISSSVLIQVIFPFFIYTIPENILICFILFMIFLIISQYKVSAHIRRFYFIKTVLLQVLFQGNVMYFVYICFGDLQSSFHFKYGDRISLVFTVVFLWVVLVFALGFYPLVGHFLQKRASYFIYNCYRSNPGYLFLTVKNLVRNFMRGAIFYFLHEYYLAQLILLSIVQVPVIVLAIWLQSKKTIFMTKSLYCLWLTYHFLFILLNLSLYLEYCDDVFKNLALQMQEIVIYALITNIFLVIFVDLIPVKWLKSRKDKKLLNISSKSLKEKEKKQFQEFMNDRINQIKQNFKISQQLKPNRGLVATNVETNIFSEASPSLIIVPKQRKAIKPQRVSQQNSLLKAPKQSHKASPVREQRWSQPK